MNAIAGKVALITGGGASIGLCYAKELLRHGLRAVTLAEISKENGQNALEEINKEFGKDRAQFVNTDVTDKSQFEDAFKMTVEKFKNVDILVNNAGIMNDAVWERQIGINFVGVIHGCLLALDNYLIKHRTDTNSVVVNVASVAGLERFQAFPIYAATKHAVVGLTRAWGMDMHYCRTKIRFLTLCPGVTDTPLINDCLERNLGPAYQDILRGHLPHLTMQQPEYMAKALIEIINKGENGSVWVAEHSEPPYEVIIPSRHDLKKK